MQSSIVCPGDILSLDSSALKPGQGAISIDGKIISTVLGYIKKQENEISVTSAFSKSSYSAIPCVGSIVVARVLSLSGTHVTCEVLICDDTKLSTPFHSIIRREHIRDNEIDKIRMEDMYRPGDLVRAIVASLGDSRNLFLSTVHISNGVIFARSADGNVMVHEKEGEMKDPITGVHEKRKNALG
jgi:exosome complex component CSL4